MKHFFWISKTGLCILSILICTGLLQGQHWTEVADKPGATLQDVKKAFMKENKETVKEIEKEKQKKIQKAAKKGLEYTEEEDESKEEAYMIYKRWEHWVEPRCYPSGKIADAYRASEEFQKYLAEIKSAGKVQGIQSSAWKLVGPSGAPTGGGAGRINCVRFHPTDANTIFVGTPGGGLWQSKNGGSSWTTTTDNLTALGVSDVAIDPNTPNTMYIATGDGDAADTYSIGILKSTDGGLTWNTTGLNWTVSQQRRINRVLINPSNTNIILAATSLGVYRSTDAGLNWTLTNSTTGLKDMEFKPGDPTVVYACGKAFIKSTDGGASFSTVTSGLPTSSSVARLAIAVTPADPTYVYIIASATDYSFEGLYRSTDSGASFTSRSSSPNLLGWEIDGSDTGGQGWYDLSIAASPTNKDFIVIGGVNTWKSTNGGTSWAINTHWTGSGAPYVHADCHDIIFTSGTTYFIGCDGGVYKTTNTGSSWSDLSNNLPIAQLYGLGLSASSEYLIISGHQDNGTNLLNGVGNYDNVIGGDGMLCFIDWSSNSVMYGSLYNSSLRRSTNGGASFSSIVSGLTGTKPWVTPWCQDPKTAKTIYAGTSEVFKSTNQGTNWTQLTSFGGSSAIVALDISPSNPSIMYAARATALYKSTDGGANWTDITSGLPTSSVSITNIEIHPTDPNMLWVTFGGFSSTNKVFVSKNAGASWTNYSTGLPSLSANTVVFQNNSKNLLYVGCDVGVYYRDSTMSSWTLYNNSLPNVEIKDLEIYYPTKKLRAATYGRGVWEVDLVDPSAPSATFTVSKQSVCVNDPVTFTDQSSGSPSSWSWSFPGGNPSSSNQQNPGTVTWAAAGSYSVSLTVTNANGSNSNTAVVTVNALPTVASSPDVTIILGQSTTLTASGGTSYAWSPATGLNNLTSSSVVATPSVTTVYTVTVKNTNNCTATDQVVVTVNLVQGLSNNNDANTISLFPNPNKGVFSLYIQSAVNREINMTINDVLGRTIYSEQLVVSSGSNTKNIDISTYGKGIYFVHLKKEDGSYTTHKVCIE